MQETIFFQNLLNLYNQINFAQDELELAKIDKNISYYLADKKKQFIIVNKPNIIDVDIKSAFPTIVNCMFGDCEFTRKLNSLSDKKSKNIFIATTLRKTDRLRRINMICKMIIYGIIKENSEKVLILELKKDGILIQCNNNDFDKISFAINGREYLKNSLTEFVLKNNFSFHTTNYQKYIRCNKTSFFLEENNNLKIKGKYKYLPPKLFNKLNDYLNGEKIDLKKLKLIYSNIFFKIIKINYLKELFDDYYICSNNKIIDQNNKYIKYNINTNIDPVIYLKNFVYPLIASKRI